MKLPAILIAAILLNVLLTVARTPRSAPPPTTGAEVVGRVFPLGRSLIGHALWIRLVQDMSSDNDAGDEVVRREAARFELMTEYLPQFVEGYQYGAYLLDRWGGHDEATALLERGVAATDDFWLRVRLGANIYMFQNHDDTSAIRHLEAASRLPGHPLFVDRLLAKCHLNLGDPDGARNVLSRALENSSPHTVERGMVEEDLRRLESGL